MNHSHSIIALRHGRPASLRRGFNLVELLIALSISATLLTATMVALDASFKAYQKTVHMSATHTIARLTMHRMLALIRTVTITENNVTALLERAHLVFQRLRNRHGPTIVPELAIVSARCFVMQYDEIPNLVKILVHLRVIVRNVYTAEISIWKAFDKFQNRGLNKVNTRGLQRLEKAPG